MQGLPYALLSFGARNSTVYLFKQLVQYKIDGTFDTSYPHIATLDQELYDKALSIPESKTVSFEYIDDNSIIKYGTFNGKAAYSDYNGKRNENFKSKAAMDGWLVLDRSTSQFGLFTSYAKDPKTEVIISVLDFETKPIVKDFEPLLLLLKKQLLTIANGELKPDTTLASSWIVTLGDVINYEFDDIKWNYKTSDYKFDPYVVPDIKWDYGQPPLDDKGDPIDLKPRDAVNSKWEYGNGIGYLSVKEKARDAKALAWYIGMDAYYATVAIKGIIDLFNGDAKNDRARDYFIQESYNIQPKQIDSDKYYNARNKDVWNDVQAVVYTLKEDGKTAFDALICLQTPDSISYTAAASYESSSPRGSQVPFQFYQNANQIDLSFTLKWHIDEVRSFETSLTSKTHSTTLQDIAALAQDFTRPWRTGQEGSAIKPKLCKVVLPSVTEIGYISSVAINYTGNMTGDLFNKENGASGVISFAEQPKDNTTKSIYDSSHKQSYTYDQLEIQFNMITVPEEVKLRSLEDSAQSISWSKSQFEESNKLGDTVKGLADEAAEAVEAALKAAQLTQAATNDLVSASNDMIKAVANYTNSTPAYTIPNV